MLDDINATLEGFAALAPGWDGEAAPAVDATALYVAADMLRSIDRAAARRQVTWQDPQAAPDPDTGGVDLMYELDGAWLMVSIAAGEDTSVVVTSQRSGEEAALRRVSRNEAIDEVTAIFAPKVLVAAR